MTLLVTALAVAVLLVVGLLVAEHVARTSVLEKVRLAIEEAATAPASLEVPHRPLLLHAWRRHVPTARTTITGMALADGAALDRLDVELVDVTLTGPRLRPGVRARTGTFAAVLDAADLNLLVSLPPGISRVELRAGQVRLRTVAGVAIDTSVELVAGGLRVTPRGGVLRLLPPAGLTVALPDLPFGATITELEPVEGGVRLRGDLDPDHLVLDRR